VLKNTDLHPQIARNNLNTSSALTTHNPYNEPVTKKGKNLLKANHISDDRIMKLAERNRKMKN